MRAYAEEPDSYRQIWNVPADYSWVGSKVPKGPRLGVSYRQICNQPECSAGLQIRLNDEPIRLNDKCLQIRLIKLFLF